MARSLWDRLERIQTAFDSVLRPPIWHHTLCATLERSLDLVDVHARERPGLQNELADLVERLAVQSIDDSLAPCPLGFLEVLAEGIHALQSNQRLIHERTRQ